MTQIKSLRTGIKFKDTPIGKIPVDWEAVDLVGVSDRSIKYSFIDGDWIETPYLSDKGIRLIQTGNIGDGKFVDKNKKYISEETFKKLKCKEVSRGDILICRMAAPIGRACIAPDLDMKMITAVDCTIIKVDKKSFDTIFLNYMINFPLVRNQAEMLSGGSTRQRVSRRNLEAIKIISPPLPEQKKIAEILTTVDDVIEETDRIIEQTKELKKGLMQKLLTRGIGHKKFKKTEIGKIPVEWEVEKLSDIASKITDGTHVTPTYVDEGIPFLRVTDIQSNEINWSKVKRIPENEHLELIKRCKPEKGDILLSKNGTIGIVKIVDWDQEFSIFVSLCLIKMKRKDINRNFLAKMLSSDVCLNQAKLRSKQGTVTNLHLEEIREFIVPIPPIKEQKQINEVLTTLEEEITEEEKKKQSLDTLKKSLMQVLLTGRVRVKLH